MKTSGQAQLGKLYFKQIFAKHWETYKEEYNPRDIEIETVEKMLNCGKLEYGYTLYMCTECGCWRKVPFSCKTRICPTCGIIRIEDWSEKIKSRLFSGVEHRHIVLTTPRELWGYFQCDMNLLKVLSDAGVELMYDIIRFYRHREGITPGIICVIQTAGRAANFNPHLHLIVTEGGLDKNNHWVNSNFFYYKTLGKKWQYFLLTKLQEHLPKTEEVKQLISSLFEKRRFITHCEQEKVRKKDLAAYIVKYIVSLPIALSRIISYDDENVTYYYVSHYTGKKEVVTISALEFIHRIIQHIPEKHFKLIREAGLYARRMYKAVRLIIDNIMHSLKRISESILTIPEIILPNWRERIKRKFNKDPCICPNCKGEMTLWEIWVKGKKIYQEYKEEKETPIRITKWDYESAQ